MWLIDFLGIGAALAGWIFIPRWIDLTTSFYRRRGMGSLAIAGRPFAAIFRAACVVIVVFATVDLVRNLAHRS